MKHLITKKVVGGSRRLIFENPAFEIKEGQMVMVFRGWLGYELFYAKLKLLPQSAWFYVDLPVWRYRLLKTVSCAFVIGGFATELKIYLSGKFEDLTD